jgi:molybdenum cofactor guanylyltransferase
MMGGRSSRMGRDKCALKLGGRPVFDRILEEIRPFFGEIILSMNEPEKYMKYGFECVRDESPDRGPACGILSVMNAFEREYYQIVPCDTPFLNGAAVSSIYELSAGADVGLVRTPDGPQPLFSAFSFAARDALNEGLRCGAFRILECIKDLKIRVITPEMLGLAESWMSHFFNVNYPEDLERATAMDDDLNKNRQ